jgi:hypothetical protein
MLALSTRKNCDMARSERQIGAVILRGLRESR